MSDSLELLPVASKDEPPLQLVAVRRHWLRSLPPNPINPRLPVISLPPLEPGQGLPLRAER